MKNKAAYGSWPSSISASMVAEKSAKINDTRFHNNKIFWTESIAEQNGRNAIMMHDGAQLQCILPAPLSAKSKVHEYGGAAFTVFEELLLFVLADDQRIYCGNYLEQGFRPEALSPENENLRFADLLVDKNCDRVIAVCENHENGEVKNTLVALPLNGSQALEILHEGFDFYSNPSISPDGRWLSWLSWNAPDMPWDNSELWVAQISECGLREAKKVSGGGESLFQPQWTRNNDIVFVSDKTNWWNLYLLPSNEFANDKPLAKNILNMEAEFATPQWVFGMSTFCFPEKNKIFATYTQDGIWHLVEIKTADHRTWEDCHITHVPCTLTQIQSVCATEKGAVFIGASPSQDQSIYTYSNGEIHPLISEDSITEITADEFSVPQAMTFDTSDGQVARALFYPPQNTQYTCDDERPPLIVICHGGPTGATESSLNLKIQFWTNRGFAVADVNYRGSTGYGRQYRQQLFDKWGVYDVDDVCAIVEHLDEKGLIDKQRCVIKGSSAGGYTVLAALAFRDTFTAGVSLYGIGDLEMLAQETHKFEARYLDRLVGPYPEKKSVYEERSPIHAITKIDCPLLIFQGLQDKVVPPNQAYDLYRSMNEKKIPVALVTYEEEAHGFRKSDNIVNCLESELQFYGKIFGISVDTEASKSIHINNLPS